MTATAERDWIADLIAVQEGRSPVPLLDDDGIHELLRSAPRIAVIGASDEPDPAVERRHASTSAASATTSSR